MSDPARRQPLLAAALIVKDEEHRLPACLESLRELGELISEICVYDTGSSDATVEVAESFGCQVRRGYWDDDFARARNEALAMVESPWALMIDADERIAADPTLLRAEIERAECDQRGVHAFQIAIISRDGGRVLPVAMVARLMRTSTVHFEARVHEQVRPKDSDEALRLASLPRTTALLWHEGYGGEGVLERKARRNIALSDKEVAACRGGGASLNALTSALIHRARAAATLGDSTAVVRDCSEVRSLASHSPGRRYAGELLAEHLGASGDLAGASALLADLSDEGSDLQWVQWMAARLLAAQGDSAAALRLMRSVDGAYTSLGETVPPIRLLRDRLLLAVTCGEVEEAMATALSLALHHHDTVYAVRWLLSLWTGSVEALAGLLIGTDSLTHAELLSAAMAQGEVGAELVTALQAASAAAAG